MTARTRILALLMLLTALSAQTPAPSAAGPFIEKPYLQLGNAPKLDAKESLMLLWHAEPGPAEWRVDVQTSKDHAWRAVAPPSATTVNPPGTAAHVVYRARLTDLVPGEEFTYRVARSGAVVFTASGRARRSASQPQHFVIFGDCAQGTPSSRTIAYRASLEKPDFIFVPGDIVYSSGRISEYREKFFPVYNADTAAAEIGAPLIRSVPFIAAPGNHDTALANFGRFADALAYFLYWDQPLNGPVPSPKAEKAVHVLTGNQDAQAPFLAAAAPRYPLMANFSFDYGNAHWTVIDSNPYMDWTNPELRAWVAKDLAGAHDATWRFVAFHHPGFNSATNHFTDQWMRVLAPVFESGKVDIVFAGHVHNYQRSFPLTFAPAAQPDGKAIGPKGEVEGEWKLDHEYCDGAAAKPKGVIYIVTGAGGSGLYDQPKEAAPDTWQPFTYKYKATEHSYSVVDIDGSTFRLHQVSETGKDVDTFHLTK